MKYLRKFETEAEIKVFVQPNVVLSADTGKVSYNVDSSGVYIQHIDGSLYSIEEWSNRGFAPENANGVALILPDASFVIANEIAKSSCVWSSDSEYISGVSITQDAEKAKTMLNGASNTEKILAFDGSVHSAAYYCDAYIFPNGKKGYLPAIGEFMKAEGWISEINAARQVIGLSPLKGTYWSSTQYYGASAWVAVIGTGGIDFMEYSKQTYLTPIAFQSLW